MSSTSPSACTSSGEIFPTDRKSSIEQRLAAKVFRTKAAAPLHDRLIRYLIKRTRIDG